MMRVQRPKVRRTDVTTLTPGGGVAKEAREFSVLGPLMGGFGSQAFLGAVHARGPHGPVLKPAVFVFIPDEVVESPGLFSKVWAETEFAGEIDHVNVIGVMGLARLEEGYARVVEYADAESLRSVYRRAQTLKKPLPPAIAVALVADACMGVHYAHELGEAETGSPWVHGGVRPETLQISFAGMAKVTGYGAQVLADTLRKKGGTGLITRDAYTAPEQALGGRAAATVQSDVYALGCVLYESLTNKPPFAGDKDLAEAMIRDDLSRIGQGSGNEHVSAAAAEIILKATQKKSVDRFQSALQVRMELFERCEPASEADVKRYLDELFPPDAVPRATRIQMLRKAQQNHPAPTGRLLEQIPVELQRNHKERAAIPDDAEIEARTGQRVDDLPLVDADADLVDDAAAAAAAAALVARTLDRTSSSPPPAPAPARPTTAAPAPSRPTPVAPSSSSSSSSRAIEATDPVGQRPRPKLAPLPAPAPPVQPQVVYQTPAGLLVAVGLLGGLALALGAFVLLKTTQPPPPVVVQAPPAPLPAPAPAPAPVEPAAATTTPTTMTTPTTATATTKPASTGMSGAAATKPAAPAPSGPGKLEISSTPALDLSVDGKPVGNGAASIEVPSGPHTVSGTGPGMSLRKTVTVRAGGVERVALVVQMGSLAIEAPPGCDVIIDGKLRGKTPMESIELTQGTHKVVVKQGTIPYTQNVPIQPNLESYLQVQFHAN
jgi:serine/threonine-protein kinase